MCSLQATGIITLVPDIGINLLVVVCMHDADDVAAINCLLDLQYPVFTTFYSGKILLLWCLLIYCLACRCIMGHLKHTKVTKLK